jgi:hypothetical protein
METVREPAWLVAMADQRLALMAEKVSASSLKLYGPEIIMTPLTEPAENASNMERTRWERSCDNCGRYCKKGTFITGHVMRQLHGHAVLMTFGMCPECKELI